MAVGRVFAAGDGDLSKNPFVYATLLGTSSSNPFLAQLEERGTVIGSLASQGLWFDPGRREWVHPTTQIFC
jgi:hypothetical protein